jgi:CspA family cold shock protein
VKAVAPRVLTPTRAAQQDKGAPLPPEAARTRSRDEEDSVARGTVKWFNAQRGYGFIGQEQGTDVFVHVKDLDPGVATLSENQAVEFEVTESKKGPQAVKVRLV